MRAGPDDGRRDLFVNVHQRVALAVSGRRKERSMKLYGAHMAANPRRVKIYLAEKGLTAVEQVDLQPPYDEIRSESFLSKNPAGRIPVLELDDGTWLPESGAIIEYLEELFPEPNMLGSTPQDRAATRAFDRMTHDLFIWMRTYFPHKFERPWAAGAPRYPQVVEVLEPTIERALNNIDIRIGDNLFLTNSERPMICDCHLYALMSAGGKFGWEIPDRFTRLKGWYARFSERPSANA
jgi:glutathione S-transferase